MLGNCFTFVKYEEIAHFKAIFEGFQFVGWDASPLQP